MERVKGLPQCSILIHKPRDMKRLYRFYLFQVVARAHIRTTCKGEHPRRLGEGHGAFKHFATGHGTFPAWVRASSICKLSHYFFQENMPVQLVDF